MTQFCEPCNADDPPHAPGCSAVADNDATHNATQSAKADGLLLARSIALQHAAEADSDAQREMAERIAEAITGAAYGLALSPPPPLR